MIRIAFVSLLLCCSIVHAQSASDSLPQVKTVTHEQLNEVIKSDSGNVILVNLWATWCKPCKEELPSLLKVYREYNRKNVRLVLVSADDIDSLSSHVLPMLKSVGVDFVTYIIGDKTDEAFMSGFNPDWNGAFPTTFVYGKNGKLVSTAVGERNEQQFRKLITESLK